MMSTDSKEACQIENINIKDRPIKSMEQFDLICAHQWMEAKRKLDELAQGQPEKQHCGLLLDIFNVSSCFIFMYWNITL